MSKINKAGRKPNSQLVTKKCSKCNKVIKHWNKSLLCGSCLGKKQGKERYEQTKELKKIIKDIKSDPEAMKQARRLSKCN